MEKQYDTVIPYPVDVFRGDSWQLLINDPEKFFEIALYFRSLLKAKSEESNIDTRVSIGVECY